jgi:pimeloyl-ACP methyl ester carboxylesterase
MPILSVQGLQAYYAHRGPVLPPGPPIVFIHGAGGTHQHWLYQVRDLPRSPTYALDLPGHGRSKGPGRDRVPDYGDWLLAFLDAAGLERAVLVGHSMGGAIAQDVALRYPTRVAGLGLVGTGARLRVAPAILEGTRQDPKRVVALICDWAFGPDTPPEMVRLGQRQMSATAPDVLYGDWLACDNFDVMAQVGEISTPTLVLCGIQDRLTPVKYSTYLRDQIPGANLHLVEGAGHNVMIERPQAVVQALTAFLDRL